ncbi:DUF2703 domain-containing protein [Sinimarinibacterium sp. NLF-5-8]|uniref:DUF2703 domain-containing protein n=1 Tax=Sinimarinibacterium sp. NLF-5-8 TaxID=2698684 RepID=UPI00137BDFBE|nr:DUF2703 domain-containing protein [Sinimarinibacterium sp. NLF-5-8]QHS08861.1 DUF2703 domain-containing protein [Sinimarinibacterium sp. NLF-5-8]
MNTKTLDLLFLEVDMSNSGKKSCAACDTVTEKLDSTLKVAQPILAEAGYEVRVNRILVSTIEQANQLGFYASPTLRLADAEVSPLHVPGSDARVWHWGGKEFSDPPVGMLLDLLLRGVPKDVDTLKDRELREIPEYVKNYLLPDGRSSEASCRSCG